MAKIIYFGTNGCSEHYHIDIDMALTGEENNKWCECDNEVWIENIRKNPGRHLVQHHSETYTNYGVPFSVDEDRVLSFLLLGRSTLRRRNDRTHKEQPVFETII